MSSSRAETALLDGAARRRWQGWERPSISLLASGDIGRAASAVTATWAVIFAAMARRPFASSRGRARAWRAEHRLAAHEGQQLHETVPHQRGRAGNRKRCRFQAILTFLPAPAGARPADLTGPAWRAVLGAGHQGAGDGRLLTALVTSQDETGQQAGHSIVTLVVVGPSPADCLDVGEVFTLWRGYSVARGVITRRLFV